MPPCGCTHTDGGKHLRRNCPLKKWENTPMGTKKTAPIQFRPRQSANVLSHSSRRLPPPRLPNRRATNATMATSPPRSLSTPRSSNACSQGTNLATTETIRGCRPRSSRQSLTSKRSRCPTSGSTNTIPPSSASQHQSATSRTPTTTRRLRLARSRTKPSARLSSKISPTRSRQTSLQQVRPSQQSGTFRTMTPSPITSRCRTSRSTRRHSISPDYSPSS